MSLVRRLARPLLASSFVVAGLDAALHPMPKADAVRPLVENLAPALGLPSDPELLIRANGAAMTGAAVMLGIGRLPRLSALVLATTLVPAGFAESAFWRESEPQARRERRTSLLRNASLFGGLLLAAVDTEGRPSLAWRGRHAVRTSERVGRLARRRIRKAKRRA